MCEQVLKRFLHDFTVNMRNETKEPYSDLLSGAIASIIKEKV